MINKIEVEGNLINNGEILINKNFIVKDIVLIKKIIVKDGILVGKLENFGKVILNKKLNVDGSLNNSGEI